MTRRLASVLLLVFAWGAHARASCFGWESRWIAKDIDGLFSRLVATHAFADAVPGEWKFDQILAHDRKIELRLRNASHQPRSLIMLLGGEAMSDDVRGRVFRFRVQAGADASDAQVLVRAARVIDEAVTDAEVPCIEPEGTRGGLPAPWLKRLLGSDQDTPIPRWRALAMGTFELLILIVAVVGAALPSRARSKRMRAD